MKGNTVDFKAGDKVEILEQGKWVGPFRIQSVGGRTQDHVILSGPNGGFELYNDAPFNIRPFNYNA